MCAHVFSLLLLLLFAHSFYYYFYYTNESDTSYVARFNLELIAEFVFRTVCKYISYYRCFCCCCRCWFCWISDWFTTLYDAFRSILYYFIFGKSPPTHTHAHLHTWYIHTHSHQNRTEFSSADLFSRSMLFHLNFNNQIEIYIWFKKRKMVKFRAKMIWKVSDETITHHLIPRICVPWRSTAQQQCVV